MSTSGCSSRPGPCAYSTGVQQPFHRAVDAAGRRGIAVSFTSNGDQSEWIFDRQTLKMLGELDFVDGTLTSKSVITTRAFVDHPGQVPPAD